MPTYLYFCETHKEFEEYHSITKVLEICPKCEEEKIVPPNKVKRLINCSSKGTVELTGHELADKLKEDVKDIKRRAAKDENYLANLIGEDRAHKKLSNLQRR